MLNLDKLQMMPCKLLSEQERRKLAIAEAVISNPGVLILDEPFKGLDKESSAQIAKMLRSFT